jgi:predicted aldo/keto reductase-like oxidoreductase
MILSGMSDMDQLRQNIEFFDEKKTISDDDIAALLTAAHYETTGKAAGTVPCTACRYCMSKCPQELEIPRLLSLYNEHVYTENGFIARVSNSSGQEAAHNYGIAWMAVAEGGQDGDTEQ